jgi:hypothetical protein
MTYQIKQTSLALLMVSVFVAMGIGVLAILPFDRYIIQQKSVNIPILLLSLYVIPFVILYPLMIYVPRHFSSVNVELYVTQHGLEHRWLQHFLFQKQEDKTIPWSEIDEYVFQHDWRFDRFELYMRDGTKLNIIHNHEHDKDDFKLFVKDFLQRVEEQNAAQNAVLIRQGRKDHLWEIRVMTIALVLFALFIPFVLVNPKKPIATSKHIMLWGLYVFVLLVLLKSIQRLKKDI